MRMVQITLWLPKADCLSQVLEVVAEGRPIENAFKRTDLRSVQKVCGEASKQLRDAIGDVETRKVKWSDKAGERSGVGEVNDA
mgnify:CR=1 FL=1